MSQARFFGSARAFGRKDGLSKLMGIQRRSSRNVFKSEADGGRQIPSPFSNDTSIDV